MATPGRRLFYHPCFTARLGGVSGGKETQGWRDSSHTAMVGAGKFGSAKLPMATATYPGKAFAFPVDGRTAFRTEMKGQTVAAFGRPHPRRSLTGESDLLATEACLVADHAPSATLALQAVAHGDARWLALDRKVKLPAVAGGASDGHGGRLRDCRCGRSLG